MAIALVFAPRPDNGVPLDPGSAKPAGTKGLVDMLRVLGTEVSVEAGPPLSGTSTALLMVDDLGRDERAELRRWVDGGGTLVLADPGSPLTPAEATGTARIAFLDPDLVRQCGVAALRRVDRVEAPGAVLMKVPSGSVGCFKRGGGAWLVITPLGQGDVVTIGGADFLTNGELDKEDNAVLAAALLAPRRGGHTTIVRPPPPGGGSKGLLSLVPSRVKLALMQLAVAFAVVVLWRARRLGRPVAERQHVQLAGSELVVAVGGLMQRARGKEQAATVLRADLRRVLGERLGLPRDMPDEAVAGATAARTSAASSAVLAALAGPVPRDEAELVALAQSIESIRTEVTHVRPPAPTPTGT